MKTEYIALTVAGVAAVFFAGIALGFMIAAKADPVLVLSFCMLLLLARNDARVPIEPGIYNRGWLVWSFDRPIEPKVSA